LLHTTLLAHTFALPLNKSAGQTEAFNFHVGDL
jgi:hypothetical protein